jgi:hypothetical protein
MLASWSSRYSSLSGACCPRPLGFVGSYRAGPVAVRRHWPERSGYFESSNAEATEFYAHSAAAHRIAAMAFR